MLYILSFFSRLLTVKALTCSVNNYPVDSYRPGTVVGTGDAYGNQAGHIPLFAEPHAKRQTDRKHGATWEVRGELMKRRQEQMWVGNLLLQVGCSGVIAQRRHSTRDKDVWNWLKGREWVKSQRLDTPGVGRVGEDSCDYRGLPPLCTTVTLASHLQRH